MDHFHQMSFLEIPVEVRQHLALGVIVTNNAKSAVVAHYLRAQGCPIRFTRSFSEAMGLIREHQEDTMQAG